ncbi:hypothetical protein D4Q76_03290 [archaeon]|nr:MAG: hypothetical protein D4Q76_03290 [archaeon]
MPFKVFKSCFCCLKNFVNKLKEKLKKGSAIFAFYSPRKFCFFNSSYNADFRKAKRILIRKDNPKRHLNGIKAAFMAKEKIAEEIAEKVADLISDARAVSSISETVKSLQNQVRQISVAFGKLEKRIENLEHRAENMGNNFKTFAVEADRIISEKTEGLSRENDETITKLLAEMQDLRDMVIEIKRNSRNDTAGKVM